MPSKSDDSTRSGIKKLATGEAVIPSSTRPDGSVRKEIKVKPGYKPPEDVEVYKNRTAAAWQSRGKGGVPGAEGLGSSNALNASAAANKNAKRREARKKAAANGDGLEADDPVEDGANGKVQEPVAEPLDPEVEKAKEARKLAKKLRQAKELKSKKEGGDSLLPEQFDKVIKVNELVRQLDALGFDTEGEKKAADG
ncbi:hypothetical protein B0A48_03248 [Cryoendolithus antarcticus]|uniref:WIBG Mago-binding domain-containing protein n=1 Tax=Cryoendolithus antarcticus TaxID=1507870 RepID=A0A1V8TJU8_9PEZI|nr:hypothetical protein B0A48_03248 [Cryoendolithus antarcticus]